MRVLSKTGALSRGGAFSQRGVLGCPGRAGSGVTPPLLPAPVMPDALSFDVATSSADGQLIGTVRALNHAAAAPAYSIVGSVPGIAIDEVTGDLRVTTAAALVAGDYEVSILAANVNGSDETPISLFVTANPPTFDFVPAGDRSLALDSTIWTVTETAGSLVAFDFAPAADRDVSIGSTIWTVTQ